MVSVICSDGDCAEEWEIAAGPAEIDQLACESCGCVVEVLAISGVTYVEADLHPPLSVAA